MSNSVTLGCRSRRAIVFDGSLLLGRNRLEKEKLEFLSYSRDDGLFSRHYVCFSFVKEHTGEERLRRVLWFNQSEKGVAFLSSIE
jgi:hypothetical protein